MSELVDFDAVRRALAERYVVGGDGPFALEVRERAGDGAARVELAFADGTAWLLLAAPVCREDEVNAPAALRYNATLAVGSLAIDDGQCVIRQTVRMAAATAAEVTATLERLWLEARRLRGGRRAEAAVADLFTNLLD